VFGRASDLHALLEVHTGSLWACPTRGAVAAKQAGCPRKSGAPGPLISADNAGEVAPSLRAHSRAQMLATFRPERLLDESLGAGACDCTRSRWWPPVARAGPSRVANQSRALSDGQACHSGRRGDRQTKIGRPASWLATPYELLIVPTWVASAKSGSSSVRS
jgi:hypothetical protein